MKIRERVIFGMTSIMSLGLAGVGIYYSAIHPNPFISVPLIFAGGGFFALSAAKVLDKEEGYINCNVNCDYEKSPNQIQLQQQINQERPFQQPKSHFKPHSTINLKSKTQENEISISMQPEKEFYEEYKKYKEQKTGKKRERKKGNEPQLQEVLLNKSESKKTNIENNTWDTSKIDAVKKELDEWSKESDDNNWKFTTRYLNERKNQGNTKQIADLD